MKSANIAEIKNQFSHFIALVEQGEEVQVCKRNQAVAKIVAVPGGATANRTQLGCGKGTVKINCDLTEPALPAEDGEMLRE